MKHIDASTYCQTSGMNSERDGPARVFHNLASGLVEGQQIDAILLDFSKAFDGLYERLAVMLRHSAIQGNVLQWIQSCWTEANKFSSKACHPQPLLLSLVSLKEPSSALCPSFFYTNDLPSKVNFLSRLFTDQSLLYLKISSTSNTSALQRNLERLQQW